MNKRSITVPCSIVNLKRIRDFVRKSLKEFGVDGSQTAHLVLAVDEVCTNLIIHANENDARFLIHLDIFKKSTGLLFEFHDWGKAFDYAQYQEPHLDELVSQRKRGSLGLLLVRKIMDNVEFTQEEDHNICRLFKTVPVQESINIDR